MKNYWQFDNPQTAGKRSVQEQQGNVPDQVVDAEQRKLTEEQQTTAQRFQNVSKTVGVYGPSRRLVPISYGQTMIDVIQSHHWTESPMSAREDVPELKLTEFRILSNPMLNQMLNNIVVAGGSAGRLAGDVASITEFATDVWDNGLQNTLLQGVEDAANPAAEITRKLLASTDAGKIDHLAPYKQLYTTEPTKFTYRLPYMEDQYRSISGGFSDQSAPGIFGDVSDLAKSLADRLTLRIREPGRMIEQPKGFEFNGRERQYTTSFPLLNTKSQEDVNRNWQLLFLLMYQNTPNRITRDLIHPPCIYTASIPGVWFSKYAAITNMTVDFVGARRKMDVTSPGGTQNVSSGNGVTSTIQTIIPDAYQVSITLTELFAETQNFMYESLIHGSNISTSTR